MPVTCTSCGRTASGLKTYVLDSDYDTFRDMGDGTFYLWDVPLSNAPDRVAIIYPEGGISYAEAELAEGEQCRYRIVESESA